LLSEYGQKANFENWNYLLQKKALQNQCKNKLKEKHVYLKEKHLFFFSG